MTSWQDMFDGDSEIDLDVQMNPWPIEIRYDNAKHASNNAHRFLKRRPARIIVADDVIYSFEVTNIWRVVSNEEMMAEIRATDPEIRLDVGKLAQMVKEIKISRKVEARPFQWIDEPDNAPSPNDLILCANGIFDIKTLKLMALTEAYFATATPEWEYDPDAKCPLWMAKLDEWLHPSYHRTLQEFTGYLLTPDVSMHAMLCLLGETRGGKGTVSRIQTALIGTQHCAFPSFNGLAGDFGLEGFDDKRLIGIPDAHDTAANKRGVAIEHLKSIAAGDPITINRKGIKQLMNIILAAKIVLAANQHPNLLDESGALAAREIIIMFENSFAGKMDTELTNKLKTELSGIANWAIKGLIRLRANKGNFTIGEKGKAAHEEIKKAQSIALRFKDACLTVTGKKDDVIPLSLAFLAYENWATDNEGLNPRQRRDKTGFKKDMLSSLKKLGVGFEENQVRWHDPLKLGTGEGVRIKKRFTGVTLKRNAHPGIKSRD